MRQRRFETPAGAKRAKRHVDLAPHHPAVVEGRTLFPTRVFHPEAVDRVFKSGMHSKKIGRCVTKGKWKGMPIFTLTLEERRTCPRSCQSWSTCYGSNMQFAHRMDAGPALEGRIDKELAAFQRLFPNGFVIRLHVLGDFYSVEYIEKWMGWLRKYPALRVFGYTAHHRASLMGRMLRQPPWSRWAMRFSGSRDDAGAIVVEPHEKTPSYAIACPAQTGKASCCAECALCWQTQKVVAFSRH